MHVTGPVVLLFLSLSALPAITQAQPAVQHPADDLAPAAAPKQEISFDKSSIDMNVDPCVDFYHYACGNWQKQNPILPTRPAGVSSRCFATATITCSTRTSSPRKSIRRPRCRRSTATTSLPAWM